MQTISLQKIQTVYWGGFTIEIGALQENSALKNISESLLGSAGVGRCPGWSNRCTFWLKNQQSRKYISATELELNRFQTLDLGDLVRHLSTQVNDSYIAAYTNVFDPRRDKRSWSIPFLVYALVYPIIACNLVTLDTLSPWSEYFCTHTCSPLLSKLILMWHSTVETGILIYC